MPDSALVDTDVLIDAGRGVREAVSCLRQIERQAEPAVSAVTHMELTVRGPLTADERLDIPLHLITLCLADVNRAGWWKEAIPAPQSKIRIPKCGPTPLKGAA